MQRVSDVVSGMDDKNKKFNSGYELRDGKITAFKRHGQHTAVIKIGGMTKIITSIRQQNFGKGNNSFILCSN